MRIGIITLPLHSNYGGLLQNWALQQVLIKGNHQVETLDHISYGKINSPLYHNVKSWIRYFAGKQAKPKYQLSQKEKRIIFAQTNHFIDNHIQRTNILKSEKDFVRQSQKGGYDAYIVGSDQCWRPCYNGRSIQDMFLSFTSTTQDVKRIVYAASFGSDIWEFSEQQTERFALLSQKFNLVTVREDSGILLCKKHLNVNAKLVLDPTMLLTREDYINLINAENEPKANGGLFNYILDPSKEKTNFINRVAKGTCKEPFQVLPKYQNENRTKKNVKKHIDECVFPSVATWVRAFMDSEMTIVDSFHGMVFSIIFNKPFWVIGNAARGMSRFSSLLKILNLEDRLLSIDELNQIDYTRPIKWDRVNERLETMRKESINLLLNSLE